jgi:hypothetical protein
MGVAESVIADLVALEHCPSDQGGVTLDKAAGYEEGDFQVDLGQEVEKIRGSVRGGVAIEGDRETRAGIGYKVKDGRRVPPCWIAGSSGSRRC